MLTMLLTVLTVHGRNHPRLVDPQRRRRHLQCEPSRRRLVRTSWAEGKVGSTENEWLEELDLRSTTQIDNVAIWPGKLNKGSRTFREFSRPRTIQLHIDGKPHGSPVVLEDKMHRRVIPVGVRGRRIRSRIIDAHEGIVFTDTHIAEIAVNFPSGPLTRYDNWLQKPRRQAAAQAVHRQARGGLRHPEGCGVRRQREPSVHDGRRGRGPQYAKGTRRLLRRTGLPNPGCPLIRKGHEGTATAEGRKRHSRI